MHFPTRYLHKCTKQPVFIQSTQKVTPQSQSTLFALHHTFHNYFHCMCMPGRSNTCEHARIISASMIDTEAVLQLRITPWISCPPFRIFPIKITGLNNRILFCSIGLAKIANIFPKKSPYIRELTTDTNIGQGITQIHTYLHTFYGFKS